MVLNVISSEGDRKRIWGVWGSERNMTRKEGEGEGEGGRRKEREVVRLLYLVGCCANGISLSQSRNHSYRVVELVQQSSL